MRDVENQILKVNRKKVIPSNDTLRKLKHESSTSQQRTNDQKSSVLSKERRSTETHHI